MLTHPGVYGTHEYNMTPTMTLPVRPVVMEISALTAIYSTAPVAYCFSV